MNAMLSFFQDMIGGTTNQRPVGLTSFKAIKSIKKTVVKRHASKDDIKLSDLMRRVH